MAISAVIVPSLGTPDRQKHSTSNQFVIKLSFTLALSIILLKGFVSFKFSRGLSFAKFGRNIPAVRATPRSARMAAVGMAATALANGSMFFINLFHCETPFPPETWSTTPPDKPNSEECTNSPSGNNNPNVSYGMHSTRSSITSKIDLSGLLLLAG